MLKVSMPKHTPRRADAPGRPSRHNPHAPQTFELVELRWILQALGGVFAFALLCGYITLCVVYSRTQWQLVLHPSRAVTTTPASVGLPFTEVHFGMDNSGQPQLDGWWIPGDAPTDPTVILLHNGGSTIGDTLPIVRNLHDARLNVLLFDYRGYGLSGGQHPTEATMEADADAAFTYLTSTRNISAGNIIAYGNGVGGSLAVRLCAEHPQIAALILESPEGDLKARALTDSRSSLLPVRWLFTQDFPLAAPLQTLSTPKLLISYSVQPAPAPDVFQRASDPKMTVELPVSPASSIHESLTRFLGTYVTRPPATLSPNP
jgi:hypothetical protein